MLNYVIPVMFILSFVCAAATGRMAELSMGIVQGGLNAVELVLTLAAAMCFWSGIMKIAEASGASSVFSRLLRPVVRLIFPTLKGERDTLEAITLNVTANILGMGNAATPLGLEAMKRLSLLNSEPARASNEMIVFVVMNTAAMRLVPTTVAALRGQYGSQEPMSVMLPTLLTTLCTMTFAIITAKIGCRLSSRGRKG